jgi:hypothetical protein
MTKHALRFATAVAAAAALTTGIAFAAQGQMPRTAGFSAHVDNPWLPLDPGTRTVNVGVKDGHPARNVVTVTHRTKTIAGAPCVVVDDRLYLSGRLEERTTDWYTQDKQGNVWYFGEQTAELDAQGRVTSTEGSWQAGVDGAVPGIFMPAHPRVGKSYRQEFYKGHAEDHFQVSALFGTAGSARKSTLLTKEWTPLEPKVIDQKIYVRGIGQVVEQTARGGNEHLVLVSLRRGL